MLNYRDIFSTKDEPLGWTAVVRHDIKSSGLPIKFHYTQIPTGLKEEAIQEEQRMKQSDVINSSESPWAAPVDFFRKRDATMCIDYRKLTHSHRRTAIPCPMCKTAWIAWKEPSFFFIHGPLLMLWQVKLTEESRDKISFF